MEEAVRELKLVKNGREWHEQKLPGQDYDLRENRNEKEHKQVDFYYFL